MKTNISYIPALRWNFLTPFYDVLLHWGMREERFKMELIRQARIQPGQSILDLGCGTATLTVLIKQAYPGANVTGLDADPAVLQIGREKADQAGVNLTFDQGMAYELPYLDRSFDTVVSSLMFHHLTTQNKQQAMREVFRVLRPGGSFWIVDFGPPSGVWARIISFVMGKLEEVGDNHKGLIPKMLAQVGFKQVRDQGKFSTIFGTLYLYSGLESLGFPKSPVLKKTTNPQE